MITSRTIFRIMALGLAAFFWWLGIGSGFFIDQANEWGGGLKYLTNWVLTLNLLVAIRAFLTELVDRFPGVNTLLSSTMVMNIVVLVLYWGLQFLDQSLLNVNTDDWSLFYWVWDIYLHGGMAIILFVEGIFFNHPFSSRIRSYSLVLFIFISYIFWLEVFISHYNLTPCGTISCGFPYPFLNNLESLQRTFFYFGVWILGTVSFFISYFMTYTLSKMISLSIRPSSYKSSKSGTPPPNE